VISCGGPAHEPAKASAQSWNINSNRRPAAGVARVLQVSRGICMAESRTPAPLASLSAATPYSSHHQELHNQIHWVRPGDARGQQRGPAHYEQVLAGNGGGTADSGQARRCCRSCHDPAYRGLTEALTRAGLK